MSEEIIAILLIAVLACAASFGFGYFLCRSRGKGLGSNTELCADIQDGIDENKDRVGKLADATADIEAIINKYAKPDGSPTKSE